MEKSEVSLFTQILLATQAIAYLSNRITEVNDQMKVVLDSLNQEEHQIQITVISESVERKDRAMQKLLTELKEIAESLADDMNESDILDSSDESYAKAVFPILRL